MNRKTDYRVGVGASSILMVLVVLALAAMSLLSLSAARNSVALGDRTLDMTTNYYQAVSEAQRMLAAMDASLADHAIDNPDAATWQALLQAHGIPDITVAADLSYSFSVNAGAQRMLEVGGRLTPTQPQRYTLTRHQLVNTATAESQPLQLFQPQPTVTP